MAMRTILDLPKAYAAMTPAARRRFDTLFSFSLDEGRMIVPASMRPWAAKQFGSVAKVERQPILKVTDKVLFEGALFNKLRADRPIQTGKGITEEELLALAAKEPFADVIANTPEDTFGRLIGRSEVSASNVAKYDALHGLIVFNRVNPLSFTKGEVVDHLNAALSWIAAAHAEHPEANHPVIGWNCLWKAGASLVHGHLQVLVGKDEPYAWLLQAKGATDAYRRRTGRSYWEELFAVHASLGLGAEREGVRAFASLTPKKEKEIVLLSDAADEHLFGEIHRILAAYLALGVDSFNVALLFPPLDGSWKGFPVITRIVDRGELSARTTDIGIAELYLHQSVVSSDPVKVWRAVARKR